MCFNSYPATCKPSIRRPAAFPKLDRREQPKWSAVDPSSTGGSFFFIKLGILHRSFAKPWDSMTHQFYPASLTAETDKPRVRCHSLETTEMTPNNMTIPTHHSSLMSYYNTISRWLLQCPVPLLHLTHLPRQGSRKARRCLHGARISEERWGWTEQESLHLAPKRSSIDPSSCRPNNKRGSLAADACSSVRLASWLSVRY